MKIHQEIKEHAVRGRLLNSIKNVPHAQKEIPKDSKVDILKKVVTLILITDHRQTMAESKEKNGSHKNETLKEQNKTIMNRRKS